MRRARLDPHEQRVLENATGFTAVTFRGRGRYERIDCATRAEAEREAARLATRARPCMVYAVAGTHQALIATIEKESRPMTTNPKPRAKAKKPAAKRTAAKARASNPATECKPVRAGTSLAALVGFMIDGDKTFEQMAKALGLRVDQVQDRVRHVLRVGHVEVIYCARYWPLSGGRPRNFPPLGPTTG